MDISTKSDPIRARAVFIRLTPDLFEWVNELCEKTGHSFANIVRVLLQGARDQGVSVIPAEPLPLEWQRPKRKRRRRRVEKHPPESPPESPPEPQAASA